MTDLPEDPFMTETGLHEGSVIVAALVEVVLQRDVGGLRDAIAVLDRDSLESACAAWAVEIGVTSLVRSHDRPEVAEGVVAESREPETVGGRLLRGFADVALDGGLDELQRLVEGRTDEELRSVLFDPLAGALEDFLRRYGKGGG